jgi:hypothetical protein
VTLAGQKTSTQSPVILVDQWTGFNANTDTIEGLHPNETGELKMANKWLGALRAILPAPTPPTAPLYLSSYNWTTVSSGWGPVESNKSNGSFNLGDGNPITLNGVVYSHGLGAHADSDITYAINGKFDAFRAKIGVDDEVGSAGSVTFRVLVDGVLKYDSGLMTGDSPTQSINVPLAGKRTLELQVTDGGDGWQETDDADWADALLIRHINSPIAPTPPPAPITPPVIGSAPAPIQEFGSSSGITFGSTPIELSSPKLQARDPLPASL